MFQIRGVLFLTVLFCGCAPASMDDWHGGVAGQVRIIHDADTKTFEIVLEPVISLGSIADEEFIDDMPGTPVAADGRGRFFAATLNRERVAVFDANGRFLRTVGSAGQGPGEFRGIISGMMSHPADSLFVISGRLVSVFSPELDFVRSFHLPANYASGVVLADSRLALLRLTARNTAALLHVYSADGELLHSFLTDSLRSPTNPLGFSAGTSGLWIYRGLSHAAELWSETGEHIATVDVIGADLLQGRTPAFSVWREEPAGSLWTLSRVHAAQLPTTPPPPLPDLPSGEGGLGAVLSAPGQPIAGGPLVNLGNYSFDTVIELMDLRGGNVLASQRFNNLVLNAIANSELLFSEHANEYGVKTIKVWRLRLVRAGEPVPRGGY